MWLASGISRLHRMRCAARFRCVEVVQLWRERRPDKVRTHDVLASVGPDRRFYTPRPVPDGRAPTVHLIDIGANLSHESFAHDLSSVLDHARAAGVAQIIVT